jgi:hypothetical protein
MTSAVIRCSLTNALVQLQARYHHCGKAAPEKCLSAATFVTQRGISLDRAAIVSTKASELPAIYRSLDRDSQSKRTPKNRAASGRVADERARMA